MINSNKKEGKAAYWLVQKKQTNKQTNKEHNGRRVNRSRDHCCPDCPGALECTEQTCIRTAPHADFATTSLPPHKHKNTSFPSLAVNKQIQAYHPTGVRNYMLAAVFFFFLSFLIPGFFWKSNTQAYPYTGIIKPQAGRLIGINEQVQAYIPTCRLNSNIQADSHTGSKTTSLLPHRHRGKLQAYSHIQAKTTSFPPHRRNTKLQACCHIGNKTTSWCRHTGNKTASSQPHRQKTACLPPHRRNTKLQACRYTSNQTTSPACCHTSIEQNYKLTATQASYKTTSLPPHNWNQQNYKLSATQATQLTARCHTGILNWYCILATPLAKLKKLHSYCLTGPKGKITQMYTNWQ